MATQAHNRINSRDEFARQLLDNALAMAQKQIEGMTLQGDDKGVATVEVAVPLSICVQLDDSTEGHMMKSGPPGTLCCTCTRDGDGNVHCWGSSSRPCC